LGPKTVSVKRSAKAGQSQLATAHAKKVKFQDHQEPITRSSISGTTMSTPAAHTSHVPHAAPSSPYSDYEEDAVESIVPMIPLVLPLVGGVLMFMLAFIAMYMA
jgi:hypothetical protein